MSRRYIEEQSPYVGFEGAFQAQKDGKVWLNSLDLLFRMLSDLIVQEVRYTAYRIAGSHDANAPVWPDAETPSGFLPWNKRAARIEAYLTIFSGRDERFAYDATFLSGGGLERRLIEQFGFESYDVCADSKATLWEYPIDRADPLSAPANMRLLNIWLYSWDANFYGMAASALRADFLAVLRGEPIPLDDPTDSTEYSFGLLHADHGTLTNHFHKILCEWVSTFIGMDAEFVANAIKPTITDLELYFAILGVQPDKLHEGDVTVIESPSIDKWRSLDEIYVP